MILNILTYPNKKLFQKSVEIDTFDEDLGLFLDDMYETMMANNGIGLAAIQVGRPIRAFIVNLLNKEEIQDKNDLLEIINPKFISRNGEIIYQEGCLSVPGYYEDVKRSMQIEIEYFDRFGNPQSLKAEGLLSVAIQHENDHIDGHLFIERIGFSKRKKFDKDFKKKSKLKPI